MQSKLSKALQDFEKKSLHYKSKKGLKTLSLDFFFTKTAAHISIKAEIQAYAFGKNVWQEGYTSLYSLSEGELLEKKCGEELLQGSGLDINLLFCAAQTLTEGENISQVFLKKEEVIEAVFTDNKIKAKVKKTELEFAYDLDGILLEAKINIPKIARFHLIRK